MTKQNKRFCRECGKEVAGSHRICIHCGSPLPDNQTSEAEGSKRTERRRPLSRKKRNLFILLALIIIGLVGTHLWLNQYYAYESVEERFNQALNKNDHLTLEKMLVHEDGRSIARAEAEAFIQLMKNMRSHEREQLYHIGYDQKRFGLYKMYQVEVVDQVAVYGDAIEGLSFTFSGLTIDALDDSTDQILYGPLAPGIYEVEATYEGDYGKTSSSESVALSSTTSEPVSIGKDLPLEKLAFTVKNVEQLAGAKVHLLMNEEKIELSKDGTTEPIGPFLVDGSAGVQVVTQMPWGEVTSEKQTIDDQAISYDSEMSLYASLLPKEMYDSLTDAIVDFGDQYVESRALKSTSSLKVANEEVKRQVEKDFPEDYYTGLFEKALIRPESLVVKSNEKPYTVAIDVRFAFEGAEHIVPSYDNLYEQDYAWTLDLSYDEKSKQWTVVQRLPSNDWSSFDDADEVTGSQELQKPDEKAIEANEASDVEADLQLFIAEYTKASVEAINERDFHIMEGYVTKDGPRRKEARDYIDYLDSKGIYEEFIRTEVEEVEKVNDSTYKVTTIESFKIIRPDDSVTKTYRTVVHIKESDGEYFVDELIETKEIK